MNMTGVSTVRWAHTLAAIRRSSTRAALVPA